MLLNATLYCMMLWLLLGEFTFVMPTGRRGERSGWRSGIRHALFKVCAAYISDWKKMFSNVCCGNRTTGNTFDP